MLQQSYRLLVQAGAWRDKQLVGVRATLVQLEGSNCVAINSKSSPF
jgi:hypothetical protein